MARPEVADSFLSLLEKSRLLPDDVLAAAVERHGLQEKASADEAARTLVAEGLLTPYQAQRLLRGRYRGFFIDHYKLLEVLGSGGMGWVYIAEDLEAGGKVALKVLSESHKDDRGMLARLKLEARAGERLRHPNIVRTFRLGHTADVFDIHYLVMEFVQGVSLPELVELFGPCPWPQACDLILQAAAGLEHAHRTGIIHRDVKPANLLIDRDGRTKLLDFGLALLSGEEENEFSLTMIFGHDCLGTVEYMSPEQTFDSNAVDARSDVYGLGCTFYSALTGVFPFTASKHSEVVEAQRNRQPRPVRDRVPDVPPEVAAIVEKMMAKSPDDRFQSAAEVCAALEPFARRQPVPFDFRKVLTTRLQIANQRIAALQKRKSRARSGSGSTVAMKSAETNPAHQPESGAAQSDLGWSGTGSSAAGLSGAARSGTAQSGTAAAPSHAWSPSGREPKKGTIIAQAIEPSTVSAHLPPGDLLVPLDGSLPIPLCQDRLVIGRNAECDVQLTSGQVSGRHCELRFEDGWWRVTDLQSKNGVRVNGTEVTEQLLTPGDRLTIAGRFSFRLERPGEARPARPFVKYAVAALLAALPLLAALAWWLSSRGAP